jgi:hypothetical protein
VRVFPAARECVVRCSLCALRTSADGSQRRYALPHKSGVSAHAWSACEGPLLPA